MRSGADDGSAGFWFGTRGVDFERGPRSRARTHFWHFEIHTHILPDQRPAPMPAVLVVLVAGLAVAGMISKWSVNWQLANLLCPILPPLEHNCKVCQIALFGVICWGECAASAVLKKLWNCKLRLPTAKVNFGRPQSKSRTGVAKIHASTTRMPPAMLTTAEKRDLGAAGLAQGFHRLQATDRGPKRRKPYHVSSHVYDPIIADGDRGYSFQGGVGCLDTEVRSGRYAKAHTRTRAPRRQFASSSAFCACSARSSAISACVSGGTAFMGGSEGGVDEGDASAGRGVGGVGDDGEGGRKHRSAGWVSTSRTSTPSSLARLSRKACACRSARCAWMSWSAEW